MTESGWLSIQFEKAIAYYNSLPQWKRDMIRCDKEEYNITNEDD